MEDFTALWPTGWVQVELESDPDEPPAICFVVVAATPYDIEVCAEVLANVLAP